MSSLLKEIHKKRAKSVKNRIIIRMDEEEEEKEERA